MGCVKSVISALPIHIRHALIPCWLLQHNAKNRSAYSALLAPSHKALYKFAQRKYFTLLNLTFYAYIASIYIKQTKQLSQVRCMNLDELRYGEEGRNMLLCAGLVDDVHRRHFTIFIYNTHTMFVIFLVISFYLYL